MDKSVLKVAYILTFKGAGMAAWNYREIDVLSRNGVEVYGYPLQWGVGPYMPQSEWHFLRPNRLRTLIEQPLEYFGSPIKYLSLLKLAIRMGCLLEFLMAWDFSRDMRKVGVQHIHCHFGDRKLYTGYFCSKILDLPLTVTVHAYEILGNPNPEMFQLAAAHCKKVITVSEFNKKEINRVFGVPESHIEVIRIHGDMSDERLRASVKILIVGAFREKKGHEILFKALKKLNRADITVWVAGDGELDIRKMAEILDVSHQVIFLGHQGRDALNILYDACDFFVLPSRTTPNGDREGIPVAIMEAMSHHKPVISTKHVGIPELVPGILVDENDVDGLAKAIAYLTDHPEIRAEMGESNHNIIKEQYSDECVLELKKYFKDTSPLN